VFLDGTLFRADPAFAAVLNIRIGIDRRTCGRTNFGDLFSVSFGREEE
jgi:hypothetical protein